MRGKNFYLNMDANSIKETRVEEVAYKMKDRGIGLDA